MKKKLAGLGLVAGALVVAGHVQAQTAEIKVNGQIVPNDACQLTISGGGVYDFGTVKARSDFVAGLDDKTLALTISCNAPTKFALRALDNRPDTVAGNPGYAGIFGLGKGMAGFYFLNLRNPVGDGNGLAVLRSYSNSGVWNPEYVDALSSDSYRKAFAEKGSVVPGAYKTITADLSVQAWINKWSELDFSNGDIELDGSATLELLYL